MYVLIFSDEKKIFPKVKEKDRVVKKVFFKNKNTGL